jgi:hypothetical protein
VNTYRVDHVCEATDCTNLSPTSKHCSNACRSRQWKIDHDYRDHRQGVRNVSQRPQRRREHHDTRYAIIEADGPILTIVTDDVLAPSKRTAETTLGIKDRPDVFAVAASHLPTIAA